MFASLVLIGCNLLTANVALAGKLYKWVDDKGNLSYQDQPPPKNAKILSEKETSQKEGKEKTKPVANLPNVHVYTVEDCDLCDSIVTMLVKNKVPHIVLPLADDRNAQNRILELADSIIAPSIFIGDELIQTKSRQELRNKLEQTGFELSSE